MPVWENGFQIAKFNGPRIFMSEGREPVENTGFAGQIVISWFIVGAVKHSKSEPDFSVFDFRIFLGAAHRMICPPGLTIL